MALPLLVWPLGLRRFGGGQPTQGGLLHVQVQQSVQKLKANDKPCERAAAAIPASYVGTVFFFEN